MSRVEDLLQARVRSIDAESEMQVWVLGGGGEFVGLALSLGRGGSTKLFSKAAVRINQFT